MDVSYSLETPDEPLGLAADRLDVLLDEADPPALAEALVRDRREAGPRDADAVPEAGRVLDHLLLEARAEREEQRHGHGPPDDPEDRQERAQLLAAHVAEELAGGPP